MAWHSCLRTPFLNQPVKGSKTLLKSARQHFHANVPLISNKFSCTSCALVGFKILAHFFNTLTPITCIAFIIDRNSCNKFKRNYVENYQHLLEALLNFRNLHKISSILKKDHLHCFNMSEVIDSKKCGYLNALKLLFQNTLWKWTCSEVENTAEVFTEALFC